jgi:hypothetical protein
MTEGATPVSPRPARSTRPFYVLPDTNFADRDFGPAVSWRATTAATTSECTAIRSEQEKPTRFGRLSRDGRCGVRRFTSASRALRPSGATGTSRNDHELQIWQPRSGSLASLKRLHALAGKSGSSFIPTTAKAVSAKLARHAHNSCLGSASILGRAWRNLGIHDILPDSRPESGDYPSQGGDAFWSAITS